MDIPKLYNFGSEREKEVTLMKNFQRINNEIAMLVTEILGNGDE